MISESLIFPSNKKNFNKDKENNNHNIMSDSARIYNYVTSESLILKSEMKIEKSDNSDNLTLLPIKNDEGYALYDKCYILHDPFLGNSSSARPIKVENTDDPNYYNMELKSNYKTLVLENIESLDKSIKSQNNLKDLSSENVKKPIKILGENKPRSSDIVGNNDSRRANSIDKLEIIDLNDGISEKEAISFDDLKSLVRENSNGKNDKLLFKNSEKAAMKFAKELKNIPVSSSFVSDSNSSCKSKRKKEQRGFVLKRHRNIVEKNNNIDYSQMKLKDLINIEPFYPAPKSRVNYKSLKDSIKLKSESQKVHHRNYKSNNRITSEFSIDSNGNIVMNEIDDNPEFPKISNVEEIVIQSDDIKSTSWSFKKRKLSGKRWNSEEKENFYKALMVTSTDFTRMATIFPQRSRDDLKVRSVYFVNCVTQHGIA